MPTNLAVYQAKKAAVLTNPTAAATFLQSDNSAKAAAVYFPDQWVQAASPSPAVPSAVAFNLRAWGRVTPGTTGNFTPVIQYGVSVTAGSNTNMASGGAASYSASGCWRLDVQCVWDKTGGKINGVFFGNNASAGTIVTSAASTQITADLSTNGLGFTVSGLFGTSNASNLAYLDGLILEIA